MTDTEEADIKEKTTRLDSDRYQLFPTERLIERNDLIDRHKDIKQNIDLQRNILATGRYLADNSK